MNLTELQIELRKIEKHISQLHSEIENMKPRTNEEKKLDFDAITKIARQHPISDVEIVDAPEFIKREFISGLSYLLLTDEKNIYARLLYLNRLSIGCKLKMSAYDIYRAGLEFEDKYIEKICEDLQQYKYSFLVEAFIIANLTEKAPKNILTAIADMAEFMGCDKEEIRVLAQVAKYRLTGDVELLRNIPLPSKNRWSGKLAEYVPRKWLVSQRKECAMICIEKNRKKSTEVTGFEEIFGWGAVEKIKEYDTKILCVVQDRKKAGSIVKKGDLLCIYEESCIYEEEVEKKPETRVDFSESIIKRCFGMEKNTKETKERKERKVIKAPNDGMVFFVEKKIKGEVAEQDDKYLAVYVVSFFDEYNDFCKWIASK